MQRRRFLQSSAALGVVGVLPGRRAVASLRDHSDFPDSPGLTGYLADFITQTKYEHIPAEVLALGKKSILDGLGLALAGSTAKTGALSRLYIKSAGVCDGRSTIIGTSLKSSPRFAAFVNGISIHADDFDDTQLSIAPDRQYGLLTHPTAPVLPAALAIAESNGASGQDLLLAYHLGVEVESKIAEAISPRHYEDGFHTTGTCGSFGSVTAAAKLQGLTRSPLLNAFGIAAAEGAGLRENFGTMTKPFHAGHAAENGVVAADLASLGWTAAENILEASRGFFHAYGGSYDPAAIRNHLGNPWTFMNPGVSLKPFPSGSLAHPAMTATLKLIKEHNIAAADVDKVDVGTNRNIPNALIHHQPTTGLQAKFSMEFCIAVLFLERRATLKHFTDDFVRRPDVQSMVRKVNLYVDPKAESAGYNKMTSIITIHLRNGRTLSGASDFASGSPSDPMSYDQVADKFAGCAAFANWPAERSRAIVDAVAALERARNVSSLVDLLSS